MAIVQSFGALQATSPVNHYIGSSLSLYGGYTHTYGQLYATQPNVRTCVDFLGRNIAELALHVFRRVSDTDRERLADHQLGHWLTHPNPATTRYRLFESLACDLGIFFNAFWLKVRYRENRTGRPAIGLVRLPPEEIEVVGGLLPTGYLWNATNARRELALSEVVHFNGYNPGDPLSGLSPLETLRRILAEEAAAGEHREAFWRNGARHDGVIQLTNDSPPYTLAQLQKIRSEWQEYAAGGMRAGMTPLLPKGLDYKANAFSARDSEYLAARKLTREECAAAYHIPLPLVGILDHATFSNITEQHKHLYQDTLGPLLRMIREVIEMQLLPECDDVANVYTEFNIAQKLAGSFEEQAEGLSMAIGRPWMTPNEGRARLNYSRITDDPSADRLAQQQGGPSMSFNNGPAPARDRERGGDAIVRDTWTRQAARLAKVAPAHRAAAFDHARWTRELAADLAPFYGDEASAIAAAINDETYAALIQGGDPFPVTRVAIPRRVEATP